MDFLGPGHTCAVGGWTACESRLWKSLWQEREALGGSALGEPVPVFPQSSGVGERRGVSSAGAPAGVVSRGFPERSSRIREASLARADTAAPGSSTLDCCGLVWKWAIATFPFYAPSFLVPPVACSAKRGEVFTAAWSTLRKPRLQIAA